MKERQAMPSVRIPMSSSNGNGLQTIRSVQLTGVMSTRSRIVSFSTSPSMYLRILCLSTFFAACQLLCILSSFCPTHHYPFLSVIQLHLCVESAHIESVLRF